MTGFTWGIRTGPLIGVTQWFIPVKRLNHSRPGDHTVECMECTQYWTGPFIGLVWPGRDWYDIVHTSQENGLV